LPVHATSGYSPVLTCGDYVFVAARPEALNTAEGPIDPRACGRHLWKAERRSSWKPSSSSGVEAALATVGNTLAEVVKAQMPRDIGDAPAFNEVQNISDTRLLRPRSSTATPGFICEEGRIESIPSARAAAARAGNR
jgi:hypothetical protein